MVVYTMEYLSQVDNVVEVLSFLLSKIHFNQDIDDLNLLKHLSSLNSVIRDFKSRALQTKEEGELEGFTNLDLESEKVYQTFYFPFEELQNVHPDFDFTRIESLQFIFDKNENGVISIDNIGFMKKL